MKQTTFSDLERNNKTCMYAHPVSYTHLNIFKQIELVCIKSSKQVTLRFLPILYDIKNIRQLKKVCRMFFDQIDLKLILCKYYKLLHL